MTVILGEFSTEIKDYKYMNTLKNYIFECVQNLAVFNDPLFS